jgi:tricorn protease
MKRLLIVIALVCIPSLALADATAGYYRYPTIHNDRVVFTSESDLWTVDLSGGGSRRG